MTAAIAPPLGVAHVSDGALVVRTGTYRLTLPSERPYAYLEDADGGPIAELFVLSSAHPLSGRDDTTDAGPWRVAAETPGEIVVSLRARGSAWKEKEYVFRCGADSLAYEVTLEGPGELSEALLFGGYSSAQQRYGTGFFWSEGYFRNGFNPEPNSLGLPYFDPRGYSRIDALGGSLPGKRDWFFTPPPYCFAFEADGRWVGLGIEAPRGGNSFTEYAYHGGLGFHLSLSYEGYTAVEGSYRLPALTFYFGDDPYDVLDRHVRSLRAAGRSPQLPGGEAPAWWREPIFCGWGAQCHLAAVAAGYHPGTPQQPAVREFLRTLPHAMAHCRQDVYEECLATLEGQGIFPGTITVDDKWQVSYGGNEVDPAKWPDLRGFVEDRHARGQRVLLWLKAWDPEGLPVEECVRNAAGASVSADPTSPAYIQRLRRSVHHLLSPDGMDADGFKIDFTARMPSGPGMSAHGDAWGLELLRLLLQTVYEEAKRTKPDALVITHTPHPYLADVLDMVRLNDMADLSRLTAGVRQDLCGEMTHRARVARIACPEALIDTDNWPVTGKEQWREYVGLQPDLGVPALYYSTHIDLTQEPLGPADYRLLKAQWGRYRAGKGTT